MRLETMQSKTVPSDTKPEVVSQKKVFVEDYLDCVGPPDEDSFRDRAMNGSAQSQMTMSDRVKLVSQKR